ncbi:MAG: hypothetical protein K5686_05050 [Lachnospiraceae bacterium]|nr:hypothetical protein [Lachnospiraceae bacterium]
MQKNKEPEYFVEKKPLTRIDRMERLDRDKFYSSLHSNMVKWWNVNISDTAPEKAEYDPDAAAEELLADALGDKYFEDDIGIPDGTEDITAEAMEIYNRIQAELASDEAAKEAEIEAIKNSMGV